MNCEGKKMKEKLEKIYKNSIFLRIIGLSLNIISAILVLIGVLAIAYNDTLLVKKLILMMDKVLLHLPF